MGVFEKKYKYKPTGLLMEDDELIVVGQHLSTLGYLKSNHIGRYYTINYHYAVKEFQRDHAMSSSGILSESLILLIRSYYLKFIQDNGDQADKDTGIEHNGTTSNREVEEHIEASFFSEKNSNVLRRNNYNIVIQIGDDEQYVKAITGVRIRSKTIQIDASGQPIAESYEFIAKDLKENTEPNDTLN